MSLKKIIVFCIVFQNMYINSAFAKHYEGPHVWLVVYNKLALPN